MENKINIGCGNDIKKGWINIDLTPPCDLVADISHLPFEEASLDAVMAHNILEHIVDLVAVQRDFARMMKPGSVLDVIVPHYLSVDAWGDPTHVRGFSEFSFLPDFWIGFYLLEVKEIDIIKNYRRTKSLWLQALLKRDNEPWSSLLKKDKFNKVAKDLTQRWEQ